MQSLFTQLKQKLINSNIKLLTNFKTNIKLINIKNKISQISLSDNQNKINQEFQAALSSIKKLKTNFFLKKEISNELDTNKNYTLNNLNNYFKTNNYNSDTSILKLKKQKFSEFQINRNAINKKKLQVEIKTESAKTRIYFEKKFNKLLAIIITSFLVFWGLNAKELFARLEVDKKYRKKIKEKEEENKINLQYNDSLISQFDEKYGINKPLNDYINKLQYGNKDFNMLEEEKQEKEYTLEAQNNNHNNLNLIQNEKNEIQSEKIVIELNNNKNTNINYEIKSNFDNVKTRDINALSGKDYSGKVIVEEKEIMINKEEKRNVRKVQADGYEQISVYEKNFDNPDPRILGSTIVFDSRLDNKK